MIIDVSVAVGIPKIRSAPAYKNDFRLSGPVYGNDTAGNVTADSFEEFPPILDIVDSRFRTLWQESLSDRRPQQLRSAHPSWWTRYLPVGNRSVFMEISHGHFRLEGMLPRFRLIDIDAQSRLRWRIAEPALARRWCWS